MRIVFSSCVVLLGLLMAPESTLGQWQPGYGSGEFYGGDPLCAVQFGDRLAIGGTFVGAGCTGSRGVILTDFRKHYQVGGGLWTWTSHAGSAVHALAVHDSQLIAGGQFIGPAYLGYNNIARLEGNTWVSMGVAPGEGSLYGGRVADLIVFEGDLVAVGDFAYSQVEVPLYGVARWDGAQWQPMGDRPPGAEALAVWNGELYCGFAKWSGTDWISFGTASPPGSRVTALDAVQEGLAIGGTFISVDGVELDGTAVLDAEGLKPLGGGVFTSAVPGLGEVDWPGVGGFLTFNGHTYMLAPRHQQYAGYAILSRLSDPVGERTWWRRVEPLVTDYIWQQHGGALLAMGDRMVVISAGATEFTDLPNAAMRSGMYLQGGVWKPLVPGLGSLSVPVAVGSAGDIGWIAMGHEGLVQHMDGVSRRVDRYTEFRGLRNLEGRILAAGVINYGGDVLNIKGAIAEYDASGTRTIYGTVGLDVNYGVGPAFDTAIPWNDGYLAAFGPYYSYRFSLDVYGLAYLSELPEDPWDPLVKDFVWIALPDGPVEAMVLHDGVPWVAGAGQLHRVDGLSDAGIQLTLVATFNGPVHDLVSDADRLLVAGAFESVNQQLVNNLAAWDGTNWTEPITVNGCVNAIARDGDGVIYLGGDFYRVDDVYAPNLAVFRDGESAPFPGAPDGPVTDISLTERGLIVVGDFSSAGGHCSNHIAEWWGRGLSLPIMGPPGGGGATPRITEVRMLAPSPNPFNPRVTLAFELPRSGEVNLKIYDLAGRFVRNVLSETRAAGRHQFVWDGVDESGRPVSSGVYVAMLVADGRRDAVKMALVR